MPRVLPSVQPTRAGKSEVILTACDPTWVSQTHSAAGQGAHGSLWARELGGGGGAYNQLPGGTRGRRDYSHREAKF